GVRVGLLRQHDHHAVDGGDRRAVHLVALRMRRRELVAQVEELMVHELHAPLVVRGAVDVEAHQVLTLGLRATQGRPTARRRSRIAALAMRHCSRCLARSSGSTLITSWYWRRRYSRW